MVRSMSRWLPLLAFLMMTGCASLPDSARGRFEARAVKVDGETAYYQVFIPAASARTPGSLPVVLFLHGSGERGGDGGKQTHAGLGPYLRAHAADFPALAVFPQVPGREEWSGRNNRVALAALDAAIAEFGADPGAATDRKAAGTSRWTTHAASRRSCRCAARYWPRVRCARPCSSSRSRRSPTRTRPSPSACGTPRSGSSTAHWMTWSHRTTTAGFTAPSDGVR